MQETSSTIMLVSFTITVLQALFNPNGVIGTALTNLGTRMGGRFDSLLTMVPADATDLVTSTLAFASQLFV